MKRIEAMKNMSIDELSEALCDIVQLSSQEDNYCETCIASKYCVKGCNGFKTFLKEEIKEWSLT